MRKDIIESEMLKEALQEIIDASVIDDFKGESTNKNNLVFNNSKTRRWKRDTSKVVLIVVLFLLVGYTINLVRHKSDCISKAFG
jgi:uncharacterized protein YceH (UPF0502 family)